MLSKYTVFVVGAGASHDFEFPLGKGLAEAIQKRLNISINTVGQQEGGGDHELLRLLKQKYPDRAPALIHTFARMHDRVADYDSIDDFLDFYRDDQEVITVGKAAIVREILKHEESCALARIRNSAGYDFSKTRGAWHGPFFNIIRKGLSRGNMEELFMRVSIICFNYDRCIEQFLLASICHFGEVNEAGGKQLLQTLRIFHPYGVVGDFLQKPGGSPAIEFGAKNYDALAIANGIRTYTESVGDADFNEMHEVMAAAEQIVFLGFGFHQQNMNLLKPKKFARKSPPLVYGTVLGVPAPAIGTIKSRINHLLGQSADANLADFDCRKFMDDYAAPLA